MNIRGKFVLILGLALIINLVSGFYALYSYKSAASHEARVRDLSFLIVNASLSAQVHFKKQVQEWKNILIRGHDIDLYNKYLGQFYDEERNTRERMETLLSLLDKEGQGRETAQAFLQAHRRLGSQYRAALALYQPEKPNPHIEVDEKVRGIDREPTDLLDRVVYLANMQKQQQLTEIREEVKQSEQQVFAIIIITAFVLILLVFSLTDRMIASRILAATRVANRIRRGDLTGKIEVEGQDEAAQLLRALQTMQSSLSESQLTLKESEEKNRLLLNSTGEGIYGVDREGYCIFINPAGAHSLGYADPSELVGQKIHHLIHHSSADGSPLDIDQCRASLTYLSGRRADVDDEVFWRADGSHFPVEYHSHPIYQENALIGAVVTFSDITERKKGEEALKSAHTELADERAMLAQRVEERTAELNLANAELEKTARAKDAFLASMSHELRTPLTTVMGLTEFLSDQLYGPLNENQEKALGTIQESSQHLLALINDVLDVAKVEAGKMELSWDDVPVQQLAESSLRLIHQQALIKGLQVSTQIDPDVHIIRGDPRRLKQVLINLLGNAVKYTPDGGAIGLEIEGHREQNEVVLRVRDNGIGIPQEELGGLFRPFMQVGNTITRSGDGTGLGLALVYRMTELHGGCVEVESTPGKGSLFAIRLPWNENEEDGITATEDGKEESGRLEIPGDVSIIVAEDNPTIQSLLQEYLKKHLSRVLLANSGDEVLHLAKEERPDLILMDVQLPVMDGLETVHLIRQEPELSHIPVIALTALAMPGDRERCLEAGMDDYISKPVGMKELLHLIASHVNRRRAH
jgi:PAS domain S-box-containing protein